MSLLDYCLSDKQKALISLFEQGLSPSQVAKQLGLDEPNTRKAIRKVEARAARSGYSPEHDMDKPVPDGFLVKGVSTYYNQDGVKTAQWVKSQVDAERQKELLAEAIEVFMEGLKPLKAPKAPRKVDNDVIPWYQIGDGHFGLLAHEWEVGHNFDLKIAYQELASAFEILINETQPTERCVINDLGDFTHYENFAGVTEASKHPLDHDGRFPKMIHLYSGIMRFIVDKALEKHKQVDVIINQGNHSRTNDIWMCALLRVAYGATGRVNVLNNSSIFIPYRMGNTFVMTCHSDKAKPEKLLRVMSNDFRQDWGETEYHYIDVGHLHHKMAIIEQGGATVEMWNTLAPMDKYAHDYGFRSRQSITRVDRSKTYGEVGRRVLPIKEIREHLLKAVTKSDYVQPERREVYTV
jgi:hypothetical protein